ISFLAAALVIYNNRRSPCGARKKSIRRAGAGCSMRRDDWQRAAFLGVLRSEVTKGTEPARRAAGAAPAGKTPGNPDREDRSGIVRQDGPVHDAASAARPWAPRPSRLQRRR